jgi:hypothetical protein
MRLEKTSLILKMKLGESVTWREGRGRMEKRGGIQRLSTNPIIGKKDNNDNNDNNTGFHQLLFEPSMFLISHSRQVQAISPLFNHSRHGSLGLDYSVVILS